MCVCERVWERENETEAGGREEGRESYGVYLGG